MDLSPNAKVGGSRPAIIRALALIPLTIFIVDEGQSYHSNICYVF